MGKGGGCVPSKNKAPRVVVSNDDAPIERSISIRGQSARISNASQRNNRKLRIFIVFYSMYRHVETLARKIKEGVDGVEGVEGILYRVPETLAPEALEQMEVPLKDDEIPVISAEQLVEADGLLFGFPTRFGSMAAQMKAFFDSTGVLWREQKLAGVPAGFFVSTGTQGGGQETTALTDNSLHENRLFPEVDSAGWTAITQLAHHGMIYVPIGYTFGAGMFETDNVRGGSPYGAGIFSGDGTREPSEAELALAEHQGKYMAMIVKRYANPFPLSSKPN